MWEYQNRTEANQVLSTPDTTFASRQAQALLKETASISSISIYCDFLQVQTDCKETYPGS